MATTLLELTQQGDPGTLGTEEQARKIKLLTPQELYGLWERQNWISQEIDFGRDLEDWRNLNDEEREWAVWSLSSFFIGEERVTTQFSGLVMAYEDEQEEAFLTTQQVDEARHMQFFDRFYREVIGLEEPDIEGRLARVREDLNDAFVELFDRALVEAGQRLIQDPSDIDAKVDFITTYHMVIEGTLALTGQHFITKYWEDNDLMPGFVEGFNKVARDEHRHVAYGTWYLKRACGRRRAARRSDAGQARGAAAGRKRRAGAEGPGPERGVGDARLHLGRDPRVRVQRPDPAPQGDRRAAERRAGRGVALRLPRESGREAEHFAGYLNLISRSLAIGPGGASSACSCSAGSASLSDTPHTGHSPSAIGAAQELPRHRQRERVVRPCGDVELVAVDVRAAQPLLLRATRLVDLAGIDLDPHLRVAEAAHARPVDGSREPQPQRVAGRSARDVDPRRHRAARDRVLLIAVVSSPGLTSTSTRRPSPGERTKRARSRMSARCAMACQSRASRGLRLRLA